MQIKKFLPLGILCACVFVTNAQTSPDGSTNNLKNTSNTDPQYKAAAFNEDDQKFGSIKGRITTADGSVAPYVSVILKGTSFGAITDEDGQYQIRRVPAGDYTIVVSAVGLYPKEKEVRVTGRG